jgi:transposase-like protein
MREGKKYQCNGCESQNTLKGNLKSIHEEQKYQCREFEYQATTKGHLIA